MNRNEIIIVGSGIAALTAAIALSDEKNVIIFTKSTVDAGNSALAQGGIAVALGANDSPFDHLEDTLIAGAEHTTVEHTKTLLNAGPSVIKKWITHGMTFDKNSNDELAFAMEGGHRKRRIIHAGGDATGKIIVNFLLNCLFKKPSVRIIEHEIVLDLIVESDRCIGVLTEDAYGIRHRFYSHSVLLATGGTGSLFSHTSNHPNATGDGLAMAYRAGAQLRDLEFMQFHPTLLRNGDVSAGLISEAVRGEGATLINTSGETFMENVHPQKNLAPRDIVARAIFDQIQLGHEVFLDISQVKNFENRFPTIAKLCTNARIDLSTEKIPVIPGAHFMMGGIAATPSGKTSIPGLFAVGEVACTGVHGANRIASNSLLEAIVFGEKTAEAILTADFEIEKHSKPIVQKEAKMDITLPTKKEIQEKMTQFAGLERTEIGLTELITWLTSFTFLKVDLNNLTREEIEIVNMLTSAWLIATSAIQRTESRGGHYRMDYPSKSTAWTGRIVSRDLSENLLERNITEVI